MRAYDTVNKLYKIGTGTVTNCIYPRRYVYFHCTALSTLRRGNRRRDRLKKPKKEIIFGIKRQRKRAAA